MTDPQVFPSLMTLLDYPDVEEVLVRGTSPVTVRTRDGRRIPAAELRPMSEPVAPGEPR